MLKISTNYLTNNIHFQQNNVKNLLQFPNYQFAKAKSNKKLIKYYESKPNIFKKVAKLKFSNFRDPNLKFPINIPIKYRYVYRPTRSLIKLTHHDYLNFRNMTGNEVLLNLENIDQFRPIEVAGILSKLSSIPQQKQFDWNNHEYIQNSIEVIIKNSSQYKTNILSSIIRSLNKLRIDHEQLWSVLERDVNKLIHRVKPRAFGEIYLAFMNNHDKVSKEIKDRLASLLPIHLSKMNSYLITRCFYQTIKQGLMNDHIFLNHFHVLFWRRNIWFGADNYPQIIKGLTDMKYNDHDEFWFVFFLPKIEKLSLNMDEKQCEVLIESLKNLQNSINNIKTDKYIQILEDRIVYCNTQLKAIENAKFYNIVLNDIEYYKEKENLRLQKAM